MPSKRPPAVRKSAYVEIDLKAWKERGELVAVGDPILAPTVTSRVPSGRFEITYTAELFDVLRKLGNKKIEVFAYLLDKKDGNNSINTTIREIARETGISTKTVNAAVRVLQDAGLLRRKGTVYMLSPGLMVKGNQLREAYLMRKYMEISDQEAAFDDAETVDVDPQYSMLEDGSIVQKAIQPNRKISR